MLYMGHVDDSAHNDIGNGIDDLGNEGHPDQEATGQAKNIRIELGQICTGDCIVAHIQQAGTCEVAQQQLRLLRVGGFDSGLQQGRIKQPHFDFIRHDHSSKYFSSKCKISHRHCNIFRSLC